MIVRPLTEADAEQYRALIVGGMEEHVESFRISIEDAVEPLVPFILEKEDAFTLGALDDKGRLVGVVSFERETRVKLRHKGLLYRMYVRADAAGKGTGRRLMEEAIERAGGIKGLEQINLTVIASNARARRLYTSLGFGPFALEKGGLKMGEKYFDEEQMALSLRDKPREAK